MRAWKPLLSLLFLLISSQPGLPETNIEAFSGADFYIRGAVVDDRLGQRVALGDINGDFLADLILSTRFSDPPGRLRAGAVYVIFGRNTPELGGAWLLEEQAADLTLLGATAEDRLGMSYESPQAPVAVGDLNGDSIGDLIIGAPRASPERRQEAGAVYVFWGRSSFPEVWDLALTPADVVILGVTPFAHLGGAVAVGDLDGDGLTDLLLGSPHYRRGSLYPYGRLDVLRGGPPFGAMSRRDLAAEAADWTILGASEQEQFGANLAIGDANGDGLNDLLVGVPGAHLEALDSRGKAYLFFGQGDRLSGGVTDLAVEAADCTLVGQDPRDRFGHAVGLYRLLSGLEDDLVVSAPGAFPETGDPEVDRLREAWGAVYLFRGREQFPEKIQLPFQSADVTIYGTTDGDRLGYQLAAGRLASRSAEDLVVGTFAMERSLELQGEGLVVLFPTDAMGYRAGQMLTLEVPGPESRIWGGRAGEGLCTGLAAGDINGDGFDDLLIGAPASRDAGGRSYLFYGEGLGLSGIRIARWNLYR